MAGQDEKPLWRVQIERILNEKAFYEATKVPRAEWDRYDSCWDRLEDPPEEWSNIFAEIIRRVYQRLSLPETISLVFHMGQVWEIYKSTTRKQ